MTRPETPLPAMSPALLLRALFKRRGRSSAPVRTIYRLDAIDRIHAGRYSRMLGLRQDEVPLTYCYLLAQRAHLATMLGPGFPFRIPGLIHVENALAAGAPLDPDSALNITTELVIAPPGARGAVHCVFKTSGEQDGREVFSCTSTYLAVPAQRSKAPVQPRAPEPDMPLIAQWDLASSTGRAYAAVSGDWNPIHLSGWSARLMGLRAPIIHGMHTVGKTCAALENLQGGRVVSIAARFTAPLPLGTRACLRADTKSHSFTVACNDRTAVSGSFLLG
jgi:acyl dehydratase